MWKNGTMRYTLLESCDSQQPSPSVGEQQEKIYEITVVSTSAQHRPDPRRMRPPPSPPVPDEEDGHEYRTTITVPVEGEFANLVVTHPEQEVQLRGTAIVPIEKVTEGSFENVFSSCERIFGPLVRPTAGSTSTGPVVLDYGRITLQARSADVNNEAGAVAHEDEVRGVATSEVEVVIAEEEEHPDSVSVDECLLAPPPEPPEMPTSETSDGPTTDVKPLSDDERPRNSAEFYYSKSGKKRMIGTPQEVTNEPAVLDVIDVSDDDENDVEYIGTARVTSVDVEIIEPPMYIAEAPTPSDSYQLGGARKRKLQEAHGDSSLSSLPKYTTAAALRKNDGVPTTPTNTVRRDQLVTPSPADNDDEMRKILQRSSAAKVKMSKTKNPYECDGGTSMFMPKAIAGLGQRATPTQRARTEELKQRERRRKENEKKKLDEFIEKRAQRQMQKERAERENVRSLERDQRSVSVTTRRENVTVDSSPILPSASPVRVSSSNVHRKSVSKVVSAATVSASRLRRSNDDKASVSSFSSRDGVEKPTTSKKGLSSKRPGKEFRKTKVEKKKKKKRNSPEREESFKLDYSKKSTPCPDFTDEEKSESDAEEPPKRWKPRRVVTSDDDSDQNDVAVLHRETVITEAQPEEPPRQATPRRLLIESDDEHSEENSATVTREDEAMVNGHAQTPQPSSFNQEDGILTNLRLSPTLITDVPDPDASVVMEDDNLEAPATSSTAPIVVKSGGTQTESEPREVVTDLLRLLQAETKQVKRGPKLSSAYFQMGFKTIGK